MVDIVKVLEQHSLLRPLSVALRQGQHQFDYQSLWLAVRHIGEELQTRDIRHAVIYADNSPAWVILDLACLYAGITCIPMPVFFSPEQCLHLIENVNPDMILCGEPLNLLPENYVAGEEVEGLDYQVFIPRQRSAERYGSAKITFTSGTTGSANGVHITKVQINNLLGALAQTVAVEDGQSSLSLLPMAVLLENVAGVYLSLLKGGQHSCPSAQQRGLLGSSRMDSQQFITCLVKYQPKALVVTPALAEVIVNACLKGALSPELFQFIAVGGSRTPRRVLEIAQSIGLPLYEGYGLSECGSVVSLNTQLHCKLGSVGKLLPHIECRAVAGELQCRGNTSPSYWLGEEKHQALRTEKSWCPTGDLGYVDNEGYLYITGRKKNVIINSYGRNITPEWVEALAEPYSAIDRLVLFGDAKGFCVALVCSSEDEVIVEAAIQALNQQLPDYAQVLNWTSINLSPLSHPQLFTLDGGPRRALIAKRFHKQITEMYSNVQPNTAI